MKRYPFPEIYLCNGEINLETKKPKRLVVDGQQRLNTIHKYIRGELKLSKLSPYKDLDNLQKRELLTYIVVVRDLGEVDLDIVKQIFRRINSVSYALNAMEIRNALYDGEYISVAKSISNLKEIEKLDVFGESQISRMKDTDLILQVMTAIEMGGYLRQDDGVEQLIIEWDNEYPHKNKMEENLRQVTRLVHDLDMPKDSIWLNKSCFYTLLVELANYNLRHSCLPKPTNLKEVLSLLHNKIMTSKGQESKTSHYSEFYYYMYQGTSSKKGREVRGSLLKEALEEIEWGE